MNKTTVIAVSLSEMIGVDEDWFLDLIAERAFGTILAENFSYRLVGIADDHNVRLEVSGFVPENED